MTVEHVGQHGDGMPVAGHVAVEGPGDAFQGEAGLDVGIFGDEIGVVVVDKLERGDRPIGDGGGQREGEANQPRWLLGRFGRGVRHGPLMKQIGGGRKPVWLQSDVVSSIRIVSEWLEKVGKDIGAAALFRGGESILVAVSGGVDSMALLAALHRLAPGRRWRLTAAHFNHQLRGKASDADERLVRRAARRLKIPVVVERGAVADFAREKGWSIEMAARQLRHEFFARTARKLNIRSVALAHHQDDQVELFFLRLLRGAGGEGLAGMKRRSRSPVDAKVFLVRPFLDCPKEALRKFAAEQGIEYSEDASNASTEIARNRVRGELLPMLREKFQPALAETILRVMEVVGAESEAVSELAEKWLKDEAGDRKVFGDLAVAAQRRIIQLQLFKLKVAPDFDLIERLRKSSGEPFMVAEGRCVVREEWGLVRWQARAGGGFVEESQRVEIKSRRGGVTFSDARICWERMERSGRDFEPALNAEEFDADSIGNRILLRYWRAGDRFRPIGAKAAVKLQDLFTNAKTPKAERHRRVVAEAANGEIFWVEGMRMGEGFKLREGTRRRLKWRWRRAQ